LAQMKGSNVLPGFDEVRLPGERSNNLFNERKKNGIPIHDNLKQALDQLSEQLNTKKIY